MIRFSNPSGLLHQTKMLNAETGEDISKLLLAESAVLKIDGGGISAVCNLAMPSFDLTAHKTEFHALNPVTQKLGPVRAIEFRDGSRVEIAEDGTPSVRSR